MKNIQSVKKRVHARLQTMIVSAALAIGMAAPASAAQSDPEVIIYRFPGVRDDGNGTNLGVATVVHCMNFSGATENIRFVVRTNNSTLVRNVAIPIVHLQTVTGATHNAVAYEEDVFLNNGTSTLIDQGSVAIAATTIDIVCTAMTIDASTAAPVGVSLRGIRFSPVPGSQE